MMWGTRFGACHLPHRPPNSNQPRKAHRKESAAPLAQGGAGVSWFAFDLSLIGGSMPFVIGASNLHPAPRAGMDDQAKSVQLRDRRHEVESETDSRRIAHLVGTIEPAQH